MILGKVTGHVWGTMKSHRLVGQKLAIVIPTQSYLHYADHVVALDSLDSAVGQTVLVCMGAPARWQADDPQIPVHAAIAAVVDDLQMEPLS